MLIDEIKKALEIDNITMVNSIKEKILTENELKDAIIKAIRKAKISNKKKIFITDIILELDNYNNYRKIGWLLKKQGIKTKKDSANHGKYYFLIKY